VQWAVQELVPFVIKSGGHSEWSTIDDNGIIIDLSRYTGIKVDSEAQTATLRGSISLKEVAVALADDGLFTGELYCIIVSKILAKLWSQLLKMVTLLNLLRTFLVEVLRLRLL
jgi:hypothetical protein